MNSEDTWSRLQSRKASAMKSPRFTRLSVQAAMEEVTGGAQVAAFHSSQIAGPPEVYYPLEHHLHGRGRPGCYELPEPAEANKIMQPGGSQLIPRGGETPHEQAR
jgi:hypothetical protein